MTGNRHGSAVHPPRETDLTFSSLRTGLMGVLPQVARKLVIVEGELERTEERAELAEA